MEENGKSSNSCLISVSVITIMIIPTDDLVWNCFVETKMLCGGNDFIEEIPVSSPEECIDVCKMNDDCFSVAYSLINNDGDWYCYPYTKKGYQMFTTPQSLVFTKICQPG